MVSLPTSASPSSGMVQVMWTWFSCLLSLDINNGDGEFLHGLPCSFSHNQLHCEEGGDSYPGKDMEQFVEDNKELIRRMYGERLADTDSQVAILSGRKFRDSVR